MNKWMGFVAVMVLGLVGCASQHDTSGLSGVSSDQARTMKGDRNTSFENSEDPPIKAETFFAAGQVAESHDDYASAVRQYREATKLVPNHKAAIYRTAICLSLLKKHNEAATTWTKYIELTGGDPRSYSNLGFCYELSGKIDAAEAAYLKGIEKDSKNVPCRTNYGLMLARIGRTGEAMVQLQIVLTPAEVHYNLASVLEAQGKREQAKVEYKKALEVDPEFKDAQTRLSALN